jgi:hypothetical protein
MNLRCQLACAALGLALAVDAHVASAEESGEEIVVPRATTTTGPDASPKQVIVIVQQQGPKQGRRAAPRVGDPEYEINEYLGDLKGDVAATRERMKDARRDGDDAAADALREQLKDDTKFYDEERNRLTTRNGGLVAGGAVLTGVGGASVLAALLLGFAYGLSGIGGSPEDGLGTAALACLGGGAAGLGAGIPMLVVGLKRVPREPDDVARQGFVGPAAGAGLVWTF